MASQCCPTLEDDSLRARKAYELRTGAVPITEGHVTFYAPQSPETPTPSWWGGHSRSIRITFCSSPCFTDRYSCRGWKRSFFRLSGDGGGEGGLLRFKYRQQQLLLWPSHTLKTAQTHLSDSWITKAFSRASRPGPGGRPTAERQPPLGRVSEGPELSMVSARGSQGGRRGSPCPRIRALWKKVLRSGGREVRWVAGWCWWRGAYTWAGRYLLALGHHVPGVAEQALRCQLGVFPHRPEEW